MRQGLALGTLNVIQQGPGGAGSGRPVRQVETVQGVDIEVILQCVACVVSVEIPVGQGGHCKPFQQVDWLAFRANQFGRGNTMQFGIQHMEQQAVVEQETLFDEWQEYRENKENKENKGDEEE